LIRLIVSGYAKSINVWFFVGVLGGEESANLCLHPDPNAAYRKGVELFEEKNYASARRQFEKIYEQRLDNTASKNTLLFTEVEYMIAVSAAENNDVDAEPLLFNFLQNHSDSHRSAYINFYLGRYYYMNNKYQECIDQLAKLSADEIPDKYRTDYKFQLGYCYFVKRNLTRQSLYLKPLRMLKKSITTLQTTTTPSFASTKRNTTKR
jgi:TolA-binding protein